MYNFYTISIRKEGENMNIEETNLLLEIYKEVKNITTKAIPRIEKQLEEIPKIKKEMEEMKVLVQEIPKMKKEIDSRKKRVGVGLVFLAMGGAGLVSLGILLG